MLEINARCRVAWKGQIYRESKQRSRNQRLANAKDTESQAGQKGFVLFFFAHYGKSHKSQKISIWCFLLFPKVWSKQQTNKIKKTTNYKFSFFLNVKFKDTNDYIFTLHFNTLLYPLHQNLYHIRKKNFSCTYDCHSSCGKIKDVCQFSADWGVGVG